MRITIVGSGYVALVAGACFSEVGIDVVCVDVDHNKIGNLNKGIIPIYKRGLEEMITRNMKKNRLKFTINISEPIKESEVVFISVGTPSDEDGSADLKYVLAVARDCGKHMDDYTLVVTKSAVPVGTSSKVKTAIQVELNKRKVYIDFDVASNLEFLKEGAAIDDFLKPDRIVFAIESSRAEELLRSLYKPFVREAPSLEIVAKLLEAGARVNGYNPVATEEIKHYFENTITYFEDQYEALINSDCLAVLTEWSEFRIPNYNLVDKLSNRSVILDSRNIYDRLEMKDKGFKYFCIGVDTSNDVLKPLLSSAS